MGPAPEFLGSHRESPLSLETFFIPAVDIWKEKAEAKGVALALPGCVWGEAP